MRASSLQELVYKQGQAGVNRATVTIVFDNSDKAQSPVGYEQHEEITITRQVSRGPCHRWTVSGTLQPPELSR